jgi:acyl carrier protein
MNTTFERLLAILARDYKVDPSSSSLDAPLDGLGIDSLGTVELLWTVEDEFKIKLPAEPVDLHTLGDVVDYIDAVIASHAALGAATANVAETWSPRT